MRHGIVLPLLCLSACAAAAQAKRSSRNLEPLTPRPGAATASARSGNTGLNIAAPPPATPANTVTQITFLGPKRGWGFVHVPCPYYSPQGKREGTLPGGTLLKYSDVKDSPKAALLVCRVRKGAAWEGPLLLDCTDVVTYGGDPDTLDPETLKSLETFYTLTGKVAERKEALAREALAENPHFESAQQSQQAYRESLAQAAEMETQMNTLTGSRKAKADDALRALKYEQVRLKAQADDAARTYKAWKDAHPASPAKAAADPALRALEQELQAVRPKVAGLTPAP